MINPPLSGGGFYRARYGKVKTYTINHTKSGVRIPKKYLSGLKGEERKKRIRQLERMKKSGKLLGSLAGDSKKKKTRRSKYTIAFEKRFGKTK